MRCKNYLEKYKAESDHNIMQDFGKEKWTAEDKKGDGSQL